MKSISFEPIINFESKILILGTMPGIASLTEHKYYAYKRNAFWPIMFQLFNIDYNDDYQFRIDLVLKNNIALWDTLKLCYREGSLDSNIEEEEPNDINSFLTKHKNIHSIIFNGLSAEKYYKKYNVVRDSISYYKMPSTSPANAKKSYDQKLADWAIIKDLLKY